MGGGQAGEIVLMQLAHRRQGAEAVLGGDGLHPGADGARPGGRDQRQQAVFLGVEAALLRGEAEPAERAADAGDILLHQLLEEGRMAGQAQRVGA